MERFGLTIHERKRVLVACRDLLQLDWVKLLGSKLTKVLVHTDASLMNACARAVRNARGSDPDQLAQKLRSAHLPGHIRGKLAAARSSRSRRVRLAEALRGWKHHELS